MRMRLLFASLLALGAAALLGGCVGGAGTDTGGDNHAYGLGTIAFTVAWPEASAEFVPSNAKSVLVTITEDSTGNVAASRLIPQGMSSVTVSGLKAAAAPDPAPGVDYTVTATAFPNLDGTGTAQATGSQTVSLNSGETATAGVSMAATADAVTLLQVDHDNVPIVDRTLGTQLDETTGFKAKWQKDIWVRPTALDTTDPDGTAYPTPLVVLVDNWEWASSDAAIGDASADTASDGVTQLGKIYGAAVGNFQVTVSAQLGDDTISQGALTTVLGPTMRLVDITKQYADPTHVDSTDGVTPNPGEIVTADLTSLDFAPTFDSVSGGPTGYPHYGNGVVTSDGPPEVTGPMYTPRTTLDRYFYVMNEGGGTVDWTATTTSRWITGLTPDGASASAYEDPEYGTNYDFSTLLNPVRCKVSITRVGLENGAHSASFTVTSNGGIQGVSVATSVPNGLASGGWATLGKDLKHTGYAAVNGPGIGAPTWSFLTGDDITSPPAVAADGTIYVGSMDGKMYAINPDGSKKWEYPVWYPIDRAGAAIDGSGNIYFGATSGMVYSLTAAGALRWSYQIPGGGVYSTPVVTGPTRGNVDLSGAAAASSDLVILTAHDRKVYAFNAATGAKVWEFATSDLLWASPAIAEDGTLYVTSADRNLYALHAIDGSLKWRYTTAEVLQGSPTVGDNDFVYFVSTNGRVYAVRDMGDRADQMWYFWGTGGGVDGIALGANNDLYVGVGNVYRLSADTGNWLWDMSLAAGAAQWTAPIVTGNGGVYIGCTNGGFYRADSGGGGSTVFGTGGAIRGAPAIGSNGNVYVGSADGRLYAFGG